jgi:hypothetical protein
MCVCNAWLVAVVLMFAVVLVALVHGLDRSRRNHNSDDDGHYWDDYSDDGSLGDEPNGITVQELRDRENAAAMPYYPSPTPRTVS